MVLGSTAHHPHGTVSGHVWSALLQYVHASRYLAEPRSAGAQIIHMAASAVATPEGENGAMSPASTMKGALEAMHSVDLSHPNVVQTYKSTQRPTQARAPRRLRSASQPARKH